MEQVTRDMDGEDLVSEQWACPNCGERRMDNLDAVTEEDMVTCMSCGQGYEIIFSAGA